MWSFCVWKSTQLSKLQVLNDLTCFTILHEIVKQSPSSLEVISPLTLWTRSLSGWTLSRLTQTLSFIENKYITTLDMILKCLNPFQINTDIVFHARQVFGNNEVLWWFLRDHTKLKCQSHLSTHNLEEETKLHDLKTYGDLCGITKSCCNSTLSSSEQRDQTIENPVHFVSARVKSVLKATKINQV